MVVHKKNGKLKIYVDFKKFNTATKKDPYLLPFTDEVINAIGHEVYTFLEIFLGYHHISIALKDQHKINFVINWRAFVWVVLPFGVKNGPPTYQRVVTKTFFIHENIYR